MKWMVCIIYVIVVGQFINSKPAVKGKGGHTEVIIFIK